MKLFEVTNGWCRESYIYVLVITDTEEKAIETATEIFRNEMTEMNYHESYCENLKAEILCEDVSMPWTSGMRP